MRKIIINLFCILFILPIVGCGHPINGVVATNTQRSEAALELTQIAKAKAKTKPTKQKKVSKPSIINFVNSFNKLREEHDIAYDLVILEEHGVFKEIHYSEPAMISPIIITLTEDDNEKIVSLAFIIGYYQRPNGNFSFRNFTSLALRALADISKEEADAFADTLDIENKSIGTVKNSKYSILEFMATKNKEHTESLVIQIKTKGYPTIKNIEI